jgi:hypothetical protein
MGQYLGSGEGTINGQRLQGVVRWDLYEVVGEARCQANFAGIIETNIGAKIRFEATGFGLAPDRSKPRRWHIANAVQFDPEDQRYDWLNTMPALWEGEFDMETYRHSAWFCSALGNTPRPNNISTKAGTVIAKLCPACNASRT